MDLREIGLGGGVEWIQLAQDRDRWRALVNRTMNFWVLAPRSMQCLVKTFSLEPFTALRLSAFLRRVYTVSCRC
jgi:hypothetical protein